MLHSAENVLRGPQRSFTMQMYMVRLSHDRQPGSVPQKEQEFACMLLEVLLASAL